MKGLYSPIDRLAAELPRTKGTGAEFMTELSKRPGYRQQEAQDRDLETLMALPKMDRAQFLESLKSKPNVMPKAKVLGGNHHEGYSLPGGTNYREILLQHPEGDFEGLPQHFGGAPNILASLRVKDRTDAEGKKILHIEELQSDWHQQGKKHGYLPEGHRAQLDAALEQAKQAEAKHRVLKNVLDQSKSTSRRMSDFLLLSNDVESLSPRGLEKQAEAKSQLQLHNNKIMELMPRVMKADEAVRQANAEHRRLLQQSDVGVPNAPFKKNWHELALKKMIHYAADNGYDGIAVTPGAEQNKRYGLAKHVESINYEDEGEGSYFVDVRGKGQHSIINRSMTTSELKSHLGKEIAQKIIDSEGEPNGMGREISGPNLEVGGEGMKGFYDKMIPSFLNQFGKKYGVKAEPRAINIDDRNGPSKTEMLRASGIPETQWGAIPYAQQERMMGDYAAKQPPKTATVHHFPITPEMRKDVLTNGLPLYAEGGSVLSAGLKTIKTKIGNGVEINVIPDPSVSNMKFFIDDQGQANLKINPIFNNDMSHIKDRHFRAVDDFLWPHEDNVYIRGANTKDDYDYLKSKTHKGSKNWATNEPEGGLSVGRGVEATMYPYSYFVKGKRIGEGSDSEHLLDLASAEPFGKLMTQKQMQDFLKKAETKKLESLGISNYQIRALKSVPVLKKVEPNIHKAEGGPVEVRPTVKDEAIQRKIPEMEAAAKALQAGVINRKEYDSVVKKHKPVKPYDFVPQPASDEDADRALMINKKPHWRGHAHWPAGRKVGLRLDIPAYEQHGVWVNSIHDEEGRDDDKFKTSYAPVSSVKNATFDASPEKAVKVATGEQNKSPFARIKGELHHMTEDEAVAHMKEHLNNPDYVQVGMDPRRHGYFYDRKNMKPITHSAHVVQIGPLVLAHKPTYGKRETYATGGTVSHETIKPTGYTKEKVTVAPDMDLMQYELMSAKRFTKKAKQ